MVDAGFPLWPTEVCDDDVPDPRNEVHYDLVVAARPELPLTRLASRTKAQRATASDLLAPSFRRLLDVLGEPEQVRP